LQRDVADVPRAVHRRRFDRLAPNHLSAHRQAQIDAFDRGRCAGIARHDERNRETAVVIGDRRAAAGDRAPAAANAHGRVDAHAGHSRRSFRRHQSTHQLRQHREIEHEPLDRLVETQRVESLRDDTGARAHDRERIRQPDLAAERPRESAELERAVLASAAFERQHRVVVGPQRCARVGGDLLEIEQRTIGQQLQLHRLGGRRAVDAHAT
jgi:hypothetical protein